MLNINTSVEYYLDISRFRFIQNHVSDITVEAKRLALKLKADYGDEWREHIPEIKGVEKAVLKELKKIDLTFPIKGFYSGDNFIIIDGTHTAYAAMLEGQKLIRTRPIQYTACDASKYYSFNDLKHHK